MSGVNVDGREIRKGAADAVEAYVKGRGGQVPSAVRTAVDTVARQGGTPLVVADGPCVLGVIQLKDIVKGGIKERFSEPRRMGIRTVMITGDNPLTAAAIAAEAGVDDFLAQATPEAKLELIRKHQTGGKLVAMTGDGTNDAPALAQADVAVAMNTGTQAAKEAGNLVDLDSNPTRSCCSLPAGSPMGGTRVGATCRPSPGLASTSSIKPLSHLLAASESSACGRRCSARRISLARHCRRAVWRRS
jgi:K+-transporting ATPase ATPase B chain